MIGNGIDIHYYTQPVDSTDQAVSLAEYLNAHGWLAYKEAEDSVIVPIECHAANDAGDKTTIVHMLVTTWRMFWEHSDSGLFGLPVYCKD